MSERLEHFGSPCTLPKEPDIVGDCEACGGDMYDYEHTICECEADIHRDCKRECVECGLVGCKVCLTEVDDGNWVCSNRDMRETDNENI